VGPILTILSYSFDNSGQKLPFPEWQSSQLNIDRTNSIFQSIANEFGPQYQTVAAIQPVNEFVSNPSGVFFWRWVA
jgi:aryl-phospho-beta-D-glucosidase BglC (GH1 family)